MECQSVRSSGAAPASIAAADMSACLPVSVGQGSLVTEHLREVCPLLGGVISPGGSNPIRSVTDGIRFFPHPLPAVPSATSLRRTYPKGRMTGLLRPWMYHGWFRLCLFADGSTATAGNREPLHLAIYLLVQACHRFGLFELTAFISSSPGLAMPSTLAPDRFGVAVVGSLARDPATRIG